MGLFGVEDDGAVRMSEKIAEEARSFACAAWGHIAMFYSKKTPVRNSDIATSQDFSLPPSDNKIQDPEYATSPPSPWPV